jgi:tRNA(fMet)-specific endonuclease VapC
MFLLDTNTLIYLFKEQGQVFENMDRVPPKDLKIPMAVFYELQVGIAKSVSPKRQTQQLSELMRKVAIAEFDKKAALAAAQVRAKLEQQGRAIGPIDVLIAGTTISLGAILVTHNTGEFSRVEGLNLTDWF